MFSLRNSLSKSRAIFKLLNQTEACNNLHNSKFHFTNKPKVLITNSGLPQEVMAKLEAECDVEAYEKAGTMPKDELFRRVSGKHGLYCFLTDAIDRNLLDAAGSQLKVISTMSAGYEHIDLSACKERNIMVSHAPDVNADSVAEWTVMLMICAGRNFLGATKVIEKGEWLYRWDIKWLLGKGLTDAVIGIVGMGRIGVRVLKRLLPFEVKRVIYFDVAYPIASAEELGAVYEDFDELVKNSDFIVTLCNLSDGTRNMFNKKVFDLMKPTAIFVNTSRGGVVNQDDLYDALKNKKIRAAAIDVTVPEPLPKDHKLLSLPNLIITPHVASSEENVLKKMAILTAENILLGVKRKPLKTPVPMPE